MPETFILYRYFFESLKDKYEYSTDKWRRCYNDFSGTVREQFTNRQSHQFIEFYTNYRNAIIKEGTDLYKLKQEYDKNPTIALK
jgi:hypothetical protein